MKRCFECKTKCMMLIRCLYDDIYEHFDGKEKKRWICLSCLARRMAGRIPK